MRAATRRLMSVLAVAVGQSTPLHASWGIRQVYLAEYENGIPVINGNLLRYLKLFISGDMAKFAELLAKRRLNAVQDCAEM